VHPSGTLVASASKDMTIRLWNNNVEGKSQSIKAHTAAIRSVSFSTDGQLLLSSSDDKTLKVSYNLFFSLLIINYSFRSFQH
jgi:centriolar protein POC1